MGRVTPARVQEQVSSSSCAAISHPCLPHVCVPERTSMTSEFGHFQRKQIDSVSYAQKLSEVLIFLLKAGLDI